MTVLIKFVIAASWLIGFGVSLFSLRKSKVLSRSRRTLCLIVVAVCAAELVFALLFYLFIGHGVPYSVYLGLTVLLFLINPVVCALGAFYIAKGAWKALMRLRFSGERVPDAGRRALIQSGVFIGVLSPMAPILAMTKNEQQEPLEVRNFRIQAPYPAEPVKILFMSDFHIGNFFPVKRLHRILAFLEKDNPDYIFLGGDLIDHHHAELDSFRWFFQELPRYGEVIATIGNHDFFGDADIVTTKLEGLGIRVLRDAVTTLKNGIPLLGARDFLWESHVHRSFAELLDERPALLLSHNPDLILHLRPWERRKVFAAISGHTHGGQIRIPGIGVLFSPSDRRFEPGWNRLGGEAPPVLLSKGVGHTGVPFRWNCPPDVLAIQLTGNGMPG